MTDQHRATAHQAPTAAATTGLLVMNRGQGRKRDYWLLCAEKFTPEDWRLPARHAPFAVDPAPLRPKCTLGKLYTKAQIIALLQKETKP